jgi:C-terminal processing protease CtpA/Prc
MEAAPGTLVPLFDPGTPPKDDGLPPAILGPRRVGVVIDRGTVSAAEVIALYARMSKRVTIYGEPTAGALDYQSISIVPIAPDERRWYLGYPTVTRNETLPVGGMRGKGIAPDVRMDLAHLRDPIGWVEEDLRRR